MARIEKSTDEVTVILEDGYTLRFWEMGLSDDEYIRRTKYFRNKENTQTEAEIK